VEFYSGPRLWVLTQPELGSWLLNSQTLNTPKNLQLPTELEVIRFPLCQFWKGKLSTLPHTKGGNPEPLGAPLATDSHPQDSRSSCDRQAGLSRVRAPGC
jgi:hypothetical protein